MTKETVTPPQDRMYVDPETGDLSIGFDKASAFAGKTGAIWDASAPLVMTSHPAFQQPEPRITFHPGDPMKEVMRIDRHGVKVSPEYTVDEATQHVLNALSAHIQRTVNHAVAQEREVCAMQAWALVLGLADQDTADIVLRAIRARGETK